MIWRRIGMEFVSAAPPPKPPLYFVSRTVDWGIIGGLSLLFYLFLHGIADTRVASAIGLNGKQQDWSWQTAGLLVWFVNWPHFSATNYRLYHSRANIAQYPFTAFIVPILLLAATWASFAMPDIVAPLFVLLYLTWSPYHFSGQSVGISMIYARRSGFKVGVLERLCLSGFIFGTFISATARLHASDGTFPSFPFNLPRFGIPPEFAAWSERGMYFCGAVFLLLAIRWCVVQRRVLPPIVLLPAAAQFVWFVPGVSIYNFYVFVPMFHSLQYMLIAWSMQLKERVDERGGAPTPRFLFSESARWYILNFIGGALLFWALPKMAERAGWMPGFAEAVLLSSVQIHHFFVDGVIWKLKNPKVSSPLLVNIPDLLREPVRAGRVTA
jgi:hypothetical protein